MPLPGDEERQRVGDDLCVIILYPDPHAERLRRRLEQLRRFDSWLQQLSPWEQRLLPLPFALFIACLATWLNSLLPPVDPDQLAFRMWFGF